MSESDGRRETIEELIAMRAHVLRVALTRNDGDLWQAANEGDNHRLLAFFEEEQKELQRCADEANAKLNGVSSLLAGLYLMSSVIEHKEALRAFGRCVRSPGRTRLQKTS